ncbi:MAG: formyl-CoA transferase [Alphaproteobacteria bacterium]|nr:formyl-CoA transferase [Alphaproteobacteria bacterium]
MTQTSTSRGMADLRQKGDPPLTGTRVLDLTQVVAGPYCTTMLADMGAEVVKLERFGVGDDTRRVQRYEGREEHEDYFNASNRCKKSIELDLKDPAHFEVGQALAAKADVVVENFAPGTAARLGMAWRDLQPLNPKLVYCSISGFGQDGPSRDRLALDTMTQAVAGMMSVTGFPDCDPVIMGAPLSDVISGMFAAYAVLGALFNVARDGEGQYIDVSMQDSLIAALGPRMGEALQAGRSSGRMGNENPIRVPSDTYRTADGRFINITVVNERHWAPFCRAIDREDWIDDPRFVDMAARIRHRADLKEPLVARFAEETLDDWMSRLDAARVPYAPVNDYAQALADPQVAHRGLVREVDHPRSGSINVIAAPWISTGGSPPITPPPLLGQHTEEVLESWLGWDSSAISAFLGSDESEEPNVATGP